MNLIAFSGLRNCVNTQYAALSGAMTWGKRDKMTVRFAKHFIGFSQVLKIIIDKNIEQAKEQGFMNPKSVMCLQSILKQ